ncbi:MAG: hypothetical protein J1F02_09355 [Lachnospiraceae bacterium]|nr:hypothetical protein [Lachnospiraceae bacterium]
MQNEMTQLSKSIYEEAMSGHMTVQEAVNFLKREAKIRSLKEKIEKYYHGQDLRQTLVSGLLHNHPDLSKDSIERRVRGWLGKDSTRSVRKQDAIEICFILKLSVEEADEFVTLVSEEALHWRNPDEVVYIFALKQGMDYREAQELNRRMEEILSDVKESKNLQENSFTPIVRAEISALRTIEELTDYLRHAVPRLGRCHNNAYKLFMEMIYTLEHPRLYETVEQAEVFDSERLTIRDILKEYLYEGNVLYAKEIARADKERDSKLSEEERLVFTTIQDSVSANWPDETTISKMKSRKMDVTRKVLILLFLATDQGLELDEEDEYQYEPTTEDVFEDLYQRLNDMLLLCGYGRLDPRSPFDWLILYCICAQDMLDVDIRMRAVFKEMFGERAAGEGGN